MTHLRDNGLLHSYDPGLVAISVLIAGLQDTALAGAYWAIGAMR
ncbi:MAG: hypothetical protein ACREXS_03930 [Gammaproteobacteria bacterium]